MALKGREEYGQYSRHIVPSLKTTDEMAIANACNCVSGGLISRM
jgi:hypothetical protein